MSPELPTHNWPWIYKPGSDAPPSPRQESSRWNIVAQPQEALQELLSRAGSSPSETAPRERFNWGFMSCFATQNRHRLPSKVPEVKVNPQSHCLLTIVFIPTSPWEALKLSKYPVLASDQLTELTKAPETSPVLLDSLVGVPRFTMLIFKSLVRVTKATDTCDLAL